MGRIDSNGTCRPKSCGDRGHAWSRLTSGICYHSSRVRSGTGNASVHPTHCSAFGSFDANDRRADYADLFSPLGSEARLGGGFVVCADSPDIRAESELFVRFMVPMGHFSPAPSPQFASSAHTVTRQRNCIREMLVDSRRATHNRVSPIRISQPKCGISQPTIWLFSPTLCVI